MIGGARVEGTTKGGRERTVSIDGFTVDVLREHRARQDHDRETAGMEWTGTEYVFTTAWGQPLYPDTLSHLMPKPINSHNSGLVQDEAAEPLPVVRLHDLRHIHATTLLLAGVPVRRDRCVTAAVHRLLGALPARRQPLRTVPPLRRPEVRARLSR